MPEFLELLPPPAALEKLLSHIRFSESNRYEVVPMPEALGRVTAAPIIAPHPLPSFPRSTVDGYAVCARDTFGANESLPAYMRVIGEISMGRSPGFRLESGECAAIHTGGMLPENSNAVVMLEYTQMINQTEIEVLRAVADGENVLKIGEDVLTGQVVIDVGKLLRPSEIGGLAALGIQDVLVVKRPTVAILSTGDEIVQPEQPIQPGQVRDVNTYTLSALVQLTGGIPISFGIVPDDPTGLTQKSRDALLTHDILVITAGSSASTRDFTAEVISRLGKPGVLVHGVNVKPGKPTILAVCDGKAVIGLPGNPVSSLVIAGLFVVPVIRYMLNIKEVIQPFIPAILSINLSSQAGREDWIPVRLIPSEKGFIAEPVFGKSNLIFSLANADGLIRIPPDATGLPAGSPVNVHPI